MKNYQILLSSLAILSSIIACSHPLEINGKGSIYSESGLRNCPYENQPCENTVVGAYTETYRTWAWQGWRFSGWSNYCLDSADECSFDVDANTVRKHWSRVMPPLVANFEQVTSEGSVGVHRPVSNSEVTLSHISNINTPICSGTSGILHGTLAFETECFEQEGLYVIAAENGSDDIRGADTPVKGRMRAILPRKQLETGWSVNPLSETAALLMQEQIEEQVASPDDNRFWQQYIAIAKLMMPRLFYTRYQSRIDGVEMSRGPHDLPYSSVGVFGHREGFYSAAIEAIHNGESIADISPLKEILTGNLLDIEQPVVQAKLTSAGSDLQLSGNILSVTTDEGVNLYEIREDSTLALASTIQLESVRFVSLQGDRLAVAQSLDDPGSYSYSYSFSANKIAIYDISDTRSPRLMGRVVDQNITGMLVDGFRIFFHVQPANMAGELHVIDASPNTTFSEAGRVDIERCGGCVSTMQIHNDILYVLQRLIGGDGGPLFTNIQTIDVRDETDMRPLGTLPDAPNSRPEYFVFAGEFAWLKAWNPEFKRNGGSFLLNWPGSPEIRLMDLRDPADLKEIELPAPPPLDILSRDIAVLNRSLVTLDAHAIRAYAYPEPRSGNNEHALSYLNPLHQTYYEMKLHGNTAFLLGDGHIATRDLNF